MASESASPSQDFEMFAEMSSLSVSNVPSRRWSEGLPQNRHYYYDEQLPPHKLTKEEWPPSKMDLSDAWAVAVVEGGASQVIRRNKWPAVFSAKELRPDYVHKGQAAKTINPDDRAYYYKILFGNRSMHGQEGANVGLSPITDAKSHGGASTTNGERCQVQSNEYDIVAAAELAIRLRKGSKRLAPSQENKSSKKRKPGSTIKPLGKGESSSNPTQTPSTGVRTRAQSDKAGGPSVSTPDKKTTNEKKGKKTTNESKGNKGKNTEKVVQVKKEVITKPGSLAELDTSSSEEEAVAESKDGQLTEMLRKAMAAQATLLKDYAAMNKACRKLAPLVPKEGIDKTTKETLSEIALLSTKSQLKERVKTNEDLVSEIHAIGLGDQVFNDC